MACYYARGLTIVGCKKTKVLVLEILSATFERGGAKEAWWGCVTPPRPHLHIFLMPALSNRNFPFYTYSAHLDMDRTAFHCFADLNLYSLINNGPSNSTNLSPEVLQRLSWKKKLREDPSSSTSRPKYSITPTLVLHIVRSYPIFTPVDFGLLLSSSLPLFFFLFASKFLVYLPRTSPSARVQSSRMLFQMTHGARGTRSSPK
jgi:hypothetical protein